MSIFDEGDDPFRDAYEGESEFLDDDYLGDEE